MRRLALTAAALAVFALWAPGCVLRSTLTRAALPEGGREVRDVPYHDGPEADGRKHRLNLFVPAGPGPHPVVVFAHGGGWFFGDREDVTDPYTKLGRRFAQRGILTVVISYRLSPAHRHPAHIEDVSRATAWTLAHAQAYGGDPARVHLMGHSAGAQLVTLAVADPQWLAAHGIDARRIAGVIAVSAPFDVHHLGQSLATKVALVQPAFGREPGAWREASPGTHLKPGSAPPFLVGWADGDYEVIRRQGAQFVRLLRARGVPVEHQVAGFKGHFSVIMDLGEPDDALGDAVAAFIHRHKDDDRRAAEDRPLERRASPMMACACSSRATARAGCRRRRRPGTCGCGSSAPARSSSRGSRARLGRR